VFGEQTIKKFFGVFLFDIGISDDVFSRCEKEENIVQLYDPEN